MLLPGLSLPDVTSKGGYPGDGYLWMSIPEGVGISQKRWITQRRYPTYPMMQLIYIPNPHPNHLNRISPVKTFPSRRNLVCGWKLYENGYEWGVNMKATIFTPVFRLLLVMSFPGLHKKQKTKEQKTRWTESAKTRTSSSTDWVKYK